MPGELRAEAVIMNLGDDRDYEGPPLQGSLPKEGGGDESDPLPAIGWDADEALIGEGPPA